MAKKAASKTDTPKPEAPQSAANPLDEIPAGALKNILQSTRKSHSVRFKDPTSLDAMQKVYAHFLKDHKPVGDSSLSVAEAIRQAVIGYANRI